MRTTHNAPQSIQIGPHRFDSIPFDPYDNFAVFNRFEVLKALAIPNPPNLGADEINLPIEVLRGRNRPLYYRPNYEPCYTERGLYKLAKLSPDPAVAQWCREIGLYSDFNPDFDPTDDACPVSLGGKMIWPIDSDAFLGPSGRPVRVTRFYDPTTVAEAFNVPNVDKNLARYIPNDVEASTWTPERRRPLASYPDRVKRPGKPRARTLVTRRGAYTLALFSKDPAIVEEARLSGLALLDYRGWPDADRDRAFKFYMEVSKRLFANSVRTPDSCRLDVNSVGCDARWLAMSIQVPNFQEVERDYGFAQVEAQTTAMIEQSQEAEKQARERDRERKRDKRSDATPNHDHFPDDHGEG